MEINGEMFEMRSCLVTERSTAEERGLRKCVCHEHNHMKERTHLMLHLWTSFALTVDYHNT